MSLVHVLVTHNPIQGSYNNNLYNNIYNIIIRACQLFTCLERLVIMRHHWEGRRGGEKVQSEDVSVVSSWYNNFKALRIEFSTSHKS